MLSIESLSKTLGMFAAYFALYESYLYCFQPNGPEKLEEELGPYFEWFFRYNNLYALIPAKDVATVSEKAQFVAVLELVAALPVVVMRNKLYGLCLLSWFYMVSVRGHVLLQTPYVPVVLTMFGFSHVALVAHVLGGVLALQMRIIQRFLLARRPSAHGGGVGGDDRVPSVQRLATDPPSLADRQREVDQKQKNKQPSQSLPREEHPGPGNE